MGDAALWLAGDRMEGRMAAAPLSARAAEIARSREELLSLLRDRPESEHELSLTDLVVEKDGPIVAGSDLKEREATSLQGNKRLVVKEIGRKKRSGRTSCGGSGDGVLLNFYMPAALTRSFTASRSSSRSLCSTSAEDCNKRTKSLKTPGCWPALWEKGTGNKSRVVAPKMSDH